MTLIMCGIVWWVVGFGGSLVFMHRFLRRLNTPYGLGYGDMATAAIVGLGGVMVVVMWAVLDVSDLRKMRRP